MKEFGSIDEFVAYLGVVQKTMPQQLLASMKPLEQEVLQAIRDELDTAAQVTDQAVSGDAFGASSMTERSSQGIAGDDPGLRTENLAESLETQVSGMQLTIGSNDERLLELEAGTIHRAPWPVLMPAVQHHIESIEKTIADAALSAMTVAQ